MKLSNDYAEYFPSFDQTPKTVVAAIAFSLAMRLCCDSFREAEQMINDEWIALYEAGIVPQKPTGKKYK